MAYGIRSRTEISNLENAKNINEYSDRYLILLLSKTEGIIFAIFFFKFDF